MKDAGALFERERRSWTGSRFGFPLLGLWLAVASSCSNEAGPDFALIDQELRNGDYPAATTALEVLQKEHGPQVEIVRRLGRAYEARKEFGKAVASYKAGVAAHPEAHELWFALGSIYLDLLQYDQALETYGRARTAGEPDANVALPLGMCRGRLGDLDGAEDEFRRASAAGVPAPLIAYNRAVILLARDRPEEARELLEEALGQQPDLAIARRELARALLFGGNKDGVVVARAIELAWKAVESMPEDWRSQDVLGEAYLAAGDWEAAKAAFVEALRLGQNPASVEEHYVRAEKMRRAALRASGSSEPVTTPDPH